MAEGTLYRCGDCQVEWRNPRRHNGDKCWCCDVRCEPVVALTIKKKAGNWGWVGSA